jgi:hypothetical protein
MPRRQNQHRRDQAGRNLGQGVTDTVLSAIDLSQELANIAGIATAIVPPSWLF